MSFTYNVTTYGAVGNGTTDDTTSIQNAINAARDGPIAVNDGTDPSLAVAKGSIVFFPKGSGSSRAYKTTAPLTLPPTVTLQGEGTGTLIKSVFGGGFDLWRGAIEMTPDGSGYVRQAGVRDLCIWTDGHCGITYDRTIEKRPATVYTEQGGSFTDRTAANNALFRANQYTLFTAVSQYLYLGFTAKADFIPNTGTQGVQGLFWTRMQQLGFKDKWGTRLDLLWEYASGTDAPDGPITTWQSFIPEAELGGGFWHYGHNGTYTPDFGTSWVKGTVHTSTPLFWIRVSSTSSVFQAPIAHHVYPGIRANINQCTFQNLFFNCGNWAIFFGLFSYCQHSTFRNIRTVLNNGGCLWVVGNSNYISECDTEGGSRSADGQARTEPGQFTMEGDGNSIRDVIAEGGGFGKFPWYCFRGADLTASNLWVEGRGPDTVLKDRVDCNLQELTGALIDRPIGRMRLENARNIVIQQALAGIDQTYSDFVTIVGDSTLTINNLWGYKEPGDMDNPRIRWNQFHSFTNRGVPLLSNVTNPVTGNLVPNGDFQNGTYGWTLTTGSGTTTDPIDHGKIVLAPDGRGTELVIAIIGDAFGNGVTVETTVSIPPGYEGSDAFFGFRADTDGNCEYERKVIDDGVDPVNYFSRVLNSQTAYRVRRVGFNGTTQTSTHALKWKVATSGAAYNQLFKYDGASFTAVSDFPISILDSVGHHFYLGADLPVNVVLFNVTGLGSGITRTVKYWDGSAWIAVSNLSDSTNNFSTGGTGGISFTTPRAESTRWKRRYINGVGSWYWLQIAASAVTTAPTISAITRGRSGRLYLSNVYCVIGQVHNQVPALQVQRRWPDGRVELTGSTTPPTGGTWKVGDVIWNNAPTAGGSMGIVCTAAGNGHPFRLRTRCGKHLGRLLRRRSPMRSPKHERWRTLVPCIGVILFSGTSLGQAAQRFWVGPPGGLWSNPANWSATSGGPGGAGVPQSLDAAIADFGISSHFDYVYQQPGVGLNLDSPLLIQQDVSSSMLIVVTDQPLPRSAPGGNGSGTWVQSAGTSIFNFNLRLGHSPSTSNNVQGFYILEGPSTLSVGLSLLVPNGLYTQTDGLCTISGGAELGGAGKSGGIDMSGGTLSVGGVTEQFGASTFSGGHTTIGLGGITINRGSITLSGGNLSTGLIVVDSLFNQFVQNGGTLFTPNRITVRETSFYRYNAGLLSAGSLDIQNGGQFVMAPGANRVAKTKGILTSGTGKVDIADNAATVDYTGASPLASIQSQIVSAYDNGSWNGSGIGSSLANATQRGVGYAEASELSSIPSIFGTVDNDTILIRSTRYGDADLSGFINLNDFNRLAANFGTGDVWTEGDFNYDGITNLADFNLLASQFGLAASSHGPTPSDWAALASVVPEPGMSLMFPIIIGALSRRRTRHPSLIFHPLSSFTCVC